LAAISVAAIAVTMTACGGTGSSGSGGGETLPVYSADGLATWYKGQFEKFTKDTASTSASSKPVPVRWFRASRSSAKSAEGAVVVRIAPSRAVNNRTLGALIRNGGRSHPGCWRWWWRRHQPWQRDRRHAWDLYDARLGAFALFG
jgi:hypothetical protein